MRYAVLAVQSAPPSTPFYPLQALREIDAYSPIDTSQRDALPEQAFNQGVAFLRNAVVIEAETKLALTSFTLMMLFTMAGIAVVLVPG